MTTFPDDVEWPPRGSLQTVPARRTSRGDGPRPQEHLPTPPTLRERRSNVLGVDKKVLRTGCHYNRVSFVKVTIERSTDPADPPCHLQRNPIVMGLRSAASSTILVDPQHVWPSFSNCRRSLGVFLGTRTIYAPRTTRWRR